MIFLSPFLDSFFFCPASVLVWLPTFLSNYKNCYLYLVQSMWVEGQSKTAVCLTRVTVPRRHVFWVKTLLSTQAVRKGNWGTQDFSGNLEIGVVSVLFPKWRFPNQASISFHLCMSFSVTFPSTFPPSWARVPLACSSFMHWINRALPAELSANGTDQQNSLLSAFCVPGPDRQL